MDNLLDKQNKSKTTSTSSYASIGKNPNSTILENIRIITNTCKCL